MSEMSDLNKDYFKHLEEEATAMLKENQNIIFSYSLKFQ